MREPAAALTLSDLVLSGESRWHLSQGGSVMAFAPTARCSCQGQASVDNSRRSAGCFGGPRPRLDAAAYGQASVETAAQSVGIKRGAPVVPMLFTDARAA